jgi:hypothetical protein
MVIGSLLDIVLGREASRPVKIIPTNPLYHILEPKKGQTLEVWYLDDDKPKMSTGCIDSLSSDAFMFGNYNPRSFFLIRMDYTSNRGLRSAVRQVKDQEGNTLYSNVDVPYDFQNAEMN